MALFSQWLRLQSCTCLWGSGWAKRGGNDKAVKNAICRTPRIHFPFPFNNLSWDHKPHPSLSKLIFSVSRTGNKSWWFAQSKSIGLIQMTFSHMAIEICSSHPSSSSSRATETHFTHLCPTSQPARRDSIKILTRGGGKMSAIRK